MDKPPSRYDIWSATPKASAHAGKLQPPLQEPHKASAHKLDELETSLLLYSYGLPVATALSGICTLPDGQSAKCTTKKISSESVDITYEISPFHLQSRPNEKIKIGSPVQLELEEVGAFRGTMASQTNDGFQVSVNSSDRNRLSSKLADLAAKRGLSPKIPIATGPSVTRIELTNKVCNYEDHCGILRTGKVVHLSQTDMLVRAPVIPPVRAIIVFKGQRRHAAEVTSTFEIGFVVSFCTPIPSNEFSGDMKFSDG